MRRRDSGCKDVMGTSAGRGTTVLPSGPAYSMPPTIINSRAREFGDGGASFTSGEGWTGRSTGAARDLGGDAGQLPGICERSELTSTAPWLELPNCSDASRLYRFG